MKVDRRIYRSLRRAQSAADTRTAILNAANRLFVELGYGRVTIGDIADAASVRPPTIYASTGGKAAILAALIDDAVHDPVVESIRAGIRSSPGPAEAVRHTAHGCRLDNERHHDTIQVMLAAAAYDQIAPATLAHFERSERDTFAAAIGRLSELGALRAGLDPARAVDMLALLLGHRAWHLLVHVGGWTWADAEQWLAGQALTAVVAS